jgi:hypothetical protein
MPIPLHLSGGGLLSTFIRYNYPEFIGAIVFERGREERGLAHFYKLL